MVGNSVRKSFLSPVKSTNDSRRMLSDRSSISYSRLVNMLAEGAVATLARMRHAG